MNTQIIESTIGIGLIFVYLLSPVDLMPLNPVDDIAVVITGLALIQDAFSIKEKVKA